MWTSIVLVSAVTLFVPRNGVSGDLECPEGKFHDKSGKGLTGCKACSTCQEGRKVMSECQNNQDTVCCPYCASDMYLDESKCVCRPCTRNCPPGSRKQKHCDEYNDAVCVRSRTRQTDRTPAEKTDQTPPYASHRETTLVINPDSDATLTVGLPLTTVGKYQTPQPHQTTSKHVLTHSVSSSRATGQPLGEAEVKSTAGVTSRHLSLPLWIVTVVLGVIAVVTVASLLLCCKLTMTCHWKRQTTRCVGVAHDHQWRVQSPLNADRFLDAVDSPDRSIRRKGPPPEARSGIGDPDSNSIGSFGSSTSMSTDGEELANRIPEWECEPVPVVWKSSAAPAAGKASEGRGDKPSFRQRPSMSMVNVYPEMSPSPSKVWVKENGQSDVFHGHYVNEGVHCCHHHHHHPECEQRQVCYHTPCVHDDYFQSTLSIGSLGSGCAV